MLNIFPRRYWYGPPALYLFKYSQANSMTSRTVLLAGPTLLHRFSYYR